MLSMHLTMLIRMCTCVPTHTCTRICIFMGTWSGDVNLRHLQNVSCSSQSGVSSRKNNLMYRNHKKLAWKLRWVPFCSSAFQVSYCCAVKDNENIWEGLFILQWLTKSMQVVTKKKCRQLKLGGATYTSWNPFTELWQSLLVTAA